MIEKEVKLMFHQGMYARASMIVVNTAGVFKSAIKIATRDLEVDAKSLMGVMMLAAREGSLLKITIDGPDEDRAMLALETLFSCEEYTDCDFGQVEQGILTKRERVREETIPKTTQEELGNQAKGRSIRKNVVIKNKDGLDPHLACSICQIARENNVGVTINFKDKSVPGIDILDMIGLRVRVGDLVRIEVFGKDREDVMQRLERLCAVKKVTYTDE
jgi:phosphocarrier protein HPr